MLMKPLEYLLGSELWLIKLFNNTFKLFNAHFPNIYHWNLYLMIKNASTSTFRSDNKLARNYTSHSFLERKRTYVPYTRSPRL